MNLIIPETLTFSHPEWSTPIIITHIADQVAYTITTDNNLTPFMVSVDEIGNLIRTLRQSGFQGEEHWENNSPKISETVQEVETKVFDIDPEEIRTKLREIGAERVFEGKLIAQWIKIGTLADHKLRVRGENEIVAVEHKTSTWDGNIHKSCIETGFRTKSIELVLQVFQDVGFILAGARSQKEREIYTLWGIHFVLDHYTDLHGHTIPWLLEVEGTCDSEVNHGLELLWLERDIQKWNWWPMDIVRHYSPTEESKKIPV